MLGHEFNVVSNPNVFHKTVSLEDVPLWRLRHELGLKSITFQWFVNPQSGPGFIIKRPATVEVFHTEPQRRIFGQKIGEVLCYRFYKVLSYENVRVYFNTFWDHGDWPTRRATQCSNPSTGKILFSSQHRPDDIWGEIGLKFNEYQSSFMGVRRLEARILPLTSI